LKRWCREKEKKKQRNIRIIKEKKKLNAGENQEEKKKQLNELLVTRYHIIKRKRNL